jgi:hypothetical protein
MKTDPDGTLVRVLAALLVAGVVGLAVWGAWLLLAFGLGALGWVISAVGNFLQAAMDLMVSFHGVVGWIGLGVGAGLGTFIAFSATAGGLSGHLRRFKRTRGPEPQA